MEGIVTYPQASSLKSLGFNEPSLGYYTMATERLGLCGCVGNPTGEFKTCTLETIYKDYSLAPFSHDVLKWFRKKGYGVEVYSKNSENKEWHFQIKKIKSTKRSHHQSVITNDAPYSTQEKAEKDCIDKLIELEKLK